ncbi:MAG: Ig-like domain-containing protein [Gemmatimonadales bacterium]
MTTRQLLALFLIGLAACSGDLATIQPDGPGTIEVSGGNGQSAEVSTGLPTALAVRVTDAAGNDAPGVTVTWSVLDGGGSIAPASSVSGADGVATTVFTLGPTVGSQRAQAAVSGLAGSPVIFTATGTQAPAGTVLGVVGGGNNVDERFSSDLWVHGNYAYTGTWGFRDEEGNTLKVWSLAAGGRPTLVRSIIVPDVGTVSDVQVSEDGRLLVLSGEQGPAGGIYLYSLTNPAAPSFLSSVLIGDAGVHTVTLSSINGRLYAFAARNPGFPEAPATDPALLIYDVTDPEAPTLVATKRFPQRAYGIHDTYVRDGIAFAFVWDDPGLVIFDVGNGIRGGSPSAPVEISRLITSRNGVCCGPSVHNGWWFHNPVTHEQRYLFVGQEGAANLGSSSSGDIHVVDVSDLAQPHEVAFFHLNGAGTHNFWMDEERQVLYAAYYNGGVVALDVSGTLSGNLSSRLLSQVKPGGAGNTFTWGVQLANGFLYAIDMLSGLWQLTTE